MPRKDVLSLGFTLRWIVATLGGFLLSLLLIEIGEKPDVGIIQAAIGVSAIASFQSLILRQRIFWFWWVFSTVFGWIVVTVSHIGALGWIVQTNPFFVLRVVHGFIIAAIGGFVIGFFQWLAIRDSIKDAWRWIVVSCLSWAIAVPIGAIIGMFLHNITRSFFGEVIGLFVTWLIFAIFTGMNAYEIFGKV